MMLSRLGKLRNSLEALSTSELGSSTNVEVSLASVEVAGVNDTTLQLGLQQHPAESAAPEASKLLFVVRSQSHSSLRRIAEFRSLHRILKSKFKNVPALDLERSLVQFPHTVSFGSIACSVLRKWLLALLKVDELAQSLELRMFLSLADVDSDDSIDDSSEDHQLDNMIDFSRQNEMNNDLNVGLDDFVTVQVIGKGSFGKVLLVRHRATDCLFALKVLDKGNILQRRQIEHTQTERNVLEYIRHPFIVTMRYAFQTERKLYLVLDYCAGGELFFHLSRCGKFSESRAKFYAAQITLALEYLHDLGIVYRDLKPENVMLDADGNIALTDFGLSKEGINDNISAYSFCGTPEYLAPEVLRRTGHGRAADWWSLGAFLYEMLTGLPPFFSRNHERLFEKILKERLRMPHHVSPEAASLLVGLLNRNIPQRLGSRRGASEIREHPFFRDIDWKLLHAKKLKPPFKPALKEADDTGIDTSNFDQEFTTLPLASVDRDSPNAKPSPEQSENPTAFKEFSYVSHSFDE